MHGKIDVFHHISIAADLFVFEHTCKNAAEEIILYKKHLLQYLLLHRTILEIFKVTSSPFS